jgi:hypothetical protein
MTQVWKSTDETGFEFVANFARMEQAQQSRDAVFREENPICVMAVTEEFYRAHEHMVHPVKPGMYQYSMSAREKRDLLRRVKAGEWRGPNV